MNSSPDNNYIKEPTATKLRYQLVSGLKLIYPGWVLKGPLRFIQGDKRHRFDLPIEKRKE
jgi:hypothetical protein